MSDNRNKKLDYVKNKRKTKNKRKQHIISKLMHGFREQKNYARSKLRFLKNIYKQIMSKK